MRTLFRWTTLALMLAATRLAAQTDTLKLSLPETEKRFLEKNLSLIAGKYNVESAKALIQQAKLWDNPTLVTDQNVYDQTRKFFYHGPGTGQIFVQLNQVFKTAGKRGKQVAMATDNAQIQQKQFDDLMRNLHYNLVLDYYQLAVLQGQSQVYDKELAVTKGLITGMEGQYKAGNISLKDLMRIKALEYSLANDDLELQRQLTDIEAELKTLLQLPANQALDAADPGDQDKTSQPLPADTTLIRMAQNRPDVLIDHLSALYAADNLRYQKALAVPDITLGPEFDQNSSYSPNYFGLSISLPLPVWNLNKGNIKSASFDQKAREAAALESRYRAGADVIAAVNRYKLTEKLYQDTHADFDQNYDKLFSGMLKSYRQKEVGLVEFIDFFDAYRETRLKLLQQRFDVHKAAADVNLNAGNTVITP
ncbi:MAG: TolC family protein [Mucilaginibacter polytrichastri]|nr:TolC family protein [Mucilaginibacter polytrichastri]